MYRWLLLWFLGWATPAYAEHAHVPEIDPSQEAIRLSTGEWPPFISKRLHHYGPLSRIVVEAFAETGIDVKFGFFPWKRAMLVARTGQWDGSALWGMHEERKAFFYYSDSVAEQTYVFFHRADDDFDWQNLSDLEGISLSATLGYNYHEAFETMERLEQIHVTRAVDDEAVMRMLINGRVRLALVERIAGYEALRKILPEAQVEHYRHHPKPQSVDGLYLLLSRKNPDNAELITRFNKALKNLRESGKIETYLEEAMRGDYRYSPR